MNNGGGEGGKAGETFARSVGSTRVSFINMCFWVGADRARENKGG